MFISTVGYEHEQACGKMPADCFHCQMGKLADGLLSGRYSKPREYQNIQKDESNKEADKENKTTDSDEEEQRGVAPRMLKRIVCKGHIDFEGFQQQDAYEFYQHFMKELQKFEKYEYFCLFFFFSLYSFVVFRPNGREKDPSRIFLAKFEQKNQCNGCGYVRYTTFEQTELKLSVPIETAQPPLLPIEGLYYLSYFLLT
jgi:ubiquitin carboxyl-terminal hydrolase 5/13